MAKGWPSTTEKWKADVGYLDAEPRQPPEWVQINGNRHAPHQLNQPSTQSLRSDLPLTNGRRYAGPGHTLQRRRKATNAKSWAALSPLKQDKLAWPLAAVLFAENILVYPISPSVLYIIKRVFSPSVFIIIDQHHLPSSFLSAIFLSSSHIKFTRSQCQSPTPQAQWQRFPSSKVTILSSTVEIFLTDLNSGHAVAKHGPVFVPGKCINSRWIFSDSNNLNLGVIFKIEQPSDKDFEVTEVEEQDSNLEPPLARKAHHFDIPIGPLRVRFFHPQFYPFTKS